jgi:ABC-type glutathione transport system ATPase component
LTDNILELRHVSKYFKDRHGSIVTAVDDVTISVGKSEILGLIGESGSGKTTIGRMTVGLTRPSKGEVILDGLDIGKTKDLKLIWRKSQYIHQDPYASLDPYMSVREVLERPLRWLLDAGRDERAKSVRGMVDVIGLGERYLDKRIQELSGGERQRVLIARAFILNPVHVVADEPTSMIDFVHRNAILQLLLKLRDEFATSFLLITHDLSVAGDVCDNIAIMNKGRVVEYGPKEQVLTDPKEDYTKALLAATPERLVSGST